MRLIALIMALVDFTWALAKNYLASSILFDVDE